MKPILIIKDHPPLVACEKMTDDNLLALQKEIEAIQDRAKVILNEYWRDVYEYLERHSFVKNAESQRYQVKDGVLYVLENADIQQQDSIKNIISRIVDDETTDDE